MIDLNKKLKEQALSGLEALEYLRRLRGTSTESLPETQDPRVKLAFGRGHKVVGPSATLEQILAAPAENDGATYVRVPVSRRERPAVHVSKEEANCFSLCWNDLIKGERVHREGTRLYALEQEYFVVDFLTREGCDPVVVYRKYQEPVIEYELRRVEPLRAEPAPLPAPNPANGIREQFTGQVDDETAHKESMGYECPSNLTRPENTEEPVCEPTAIPIAARPRKRLGRPKIWPSEAERKADWRRRKKMELAEIQTDLKCELQPIQQPYQFQPRRPTIQLSKTERAEAVRMGILKPAKQEDDKTPSVLDAYPSIRKDRGGKKSSISRKLLAKRVLEQNDQCIYCGRRFGSSVLIDGKVVTLTAQPDHFQPVADRKNDSPSNIYAADQLCNERLKGSRKFASLDEARQVIQAAWIERGWKDTPLRVTRRTYDEYVGAEPIMRLHNDDFLREILTARSQNTALPEATRNGAKQMLALFPE